MKKQREIKNITLKKSKIEIRELEGKKYIKGFIPYSVKSEDIGFYEILSAGCFTKTIQENKIFALINHDSSKVLGNSKNGTVKFEDTANGLFIEVELPETTFANDLYQSIKRGDVSTMSFGFSVIKEEWDNENNIRYIKEAKLYEVSFGVPFPAYASTTSFTEVRTLLEKKELNENEIKYLQELREKIDNKIKSVVSKPEDEPLKNTQKQEKENTDLLRHYENKLKILKMRG